MIKEYKRILIVEVNWLGDVLFSTPFIRAVREKFKNAHITCMIAPRTKEILEHNPRIDELIIYDEKGTHKSLLGKWRLVSQLRKKEFDLAVLLHRSFTRAFMTYLAGIKERAGYRTKKRGSLLTHPVEAPWEPLHKVEYFLKIAKSLGCNISNKDYEFFITGNEREYIEKELSKTAVEKEDFLVVINPGGNWAPKRWDEENFASISDILISKYKVKVVASGAEKDIERTTRIKKRMKENLITFAGKTNLKQLGALLERANVVISSDSGPMHIAVTMKSNVIALFGPTSPRLTGPYGNGSYRVIQKNVECEIPCYDLACDNYRCMKAITVDDVLEVFDHLYSSVKQE
ncbi:MAG: lipopolysaccharide heptosyltransferase II [Candidatus Omnitrophica bacterium]|nr:lipopolysaccharide heptosyltransferase II [Candidatus Omnitrophota bacterium]